MPVTEEVNYSGTRRGIGRTLAALMTLLALAGPLAAPAGADFTLYNNEQITVSSVHEWGWLYDQSRAEIVSGAYVEFLWAYGASAADISGGYVNGLRASDSSSVDMSAGEVAAFTLVDSTRANVSGASVVATLAASGSSAVDISNGTINCLATYAFAGVNISGGAVGELLAYESSTVVFHGRDFQLSGGLSLDGDRVLGTGRLAGLWFDGTPWATDIYGNHGETVVRIIPEPATCIMLSMGLTGLGLLRRRRR